jgi:chromosome partitioning protein
MIILVGSNKGGCGKSTTIINLAVAFARKYKDILILDADRQSTASRWSNDREENKITPYIQVLQKYDNLQPTLKELSNKYELILVDVAGRNSREMLSAMLIADLFICPLQCSQPDLDTLDELKDQISRATDFNPELKTFIYHTMASTNTKVKDTERLEFLTYIKSYTDISTLNSINYFRKIYKDTISEGKSVLESDNAEAKNELEVLYSEISQILNMK